jgi:hypothetical protein
MNSQLGARLVYDNCRNALIKAGFSKEKVEDAVLSQSYLRLEQPLTATGSQFQFPILINQTGSNVAVRPTEQRLSLQDGFYVSGINVYLTVAASATDAKFQLFTAPLALPFVTGAANLYTFYNGNFTLQINQVNIITGYPLYRFVQVPQTQLTAATNSPITQFDGTQDAVLEPNILLLGSNNSVLTVNLPAAIGTIDANTYAIIVLNGVKAQNISTLVA